MPVEAAFKVADEVLMQTIKGLTEIVTKPGLVNLDYADILTIMNEGGVAFIGMGEGNRETSDDPVKDAVKEALSSPLLGEISVKESKGALIRVVGGPDMTVDEAQRAAALEPLRWRLRSRGDSVSAEELAGEEENRFGGS
jgi:cell division protein FtsZ